MTRWEQYQVCCERGHVSACGLTSGSTTTYTCKHCGTLYWTEHILHERNLPERDEADTATGGE